MDMRTLRRITHTTAARILRRANHHDTDDLRAAEVVAKVIDVIDVLHPHLASVH